jgi:hypothetical protein
MSELNFDSTQYEEWGGDFEAIPAGDYKAIIDASETKNTKDGTGKYLQLTFQIIEGEYKGRLIWDNLNLSNSSQIAEEIAKKKLAKICNCIGKHQVKKSEELHNIPLLIKIGTKQYNGNNKNIVKNYKAISNNIQPQQIHDSNTSNTTNTIAPWNS